MAAADFLTTDEIILEARRVLPQAPWDYITGGAESETTMRRNRLGFDRIALRPRVLVDVSKIDPSTTFLGQKLRIPVILAPIGSMQVFTPDGGAAAARAAGDFGIIQTVSSVTQPTLEEIAATGGGPKIFQLYVQGDWEWTKDIIDRVKASGNYVGFCVTVDVAVYSRRERAMIDRWQTPSQSSRTPVNFDYRAALTWDKVDKIREYAGMPFMIKGIATAEDARLCVEHGVDVIWVSNHGGRQLDHGMGAIEVLPEIVEAAQGKVEIILDGGIQRATDVIKAIALGARVVAIGKLQGWSLAAAGTAGLVRQLEIMENEMISGMGLLGITSVDQIDKQYLRKGEVVTQPHEMSAWPNIPGVRVQ